MSQLLANERVARSNERLFVLYQNQLKKRTPKDYADTTMKLATWLSDSKAYYAAARPEIVNLLLTAQMTLREAVHHTTDVQVSFNAAQYLGNPLVASYVRLVQAVTPFRDLFVEPHLKELIFQLLRSIEGTSLPSMSIFPLASSSTNTVSQAPDLLSASKSPVMESLVASPVAGRTSSISSRGGGAGQNGPSKTDPMQDSTKGGTMSPRPESVCLGTLKDNTQHSAHDDGTLTTHHPENAVNVKEKIKSKKKKKIDISAFLQTDRQDFERKQAQSQSQVSDPAHFIKSEPETEELPPLSRIEQNVRAASTSQLSPTETSFAVPLNYPQDSRNPNIKGHVYPTTQLSISQVEGFRPSLHGLSSPTSSQLPYSDPTIGGKARKVTPLEITASQAFQNQSSISTPLVSMSGAISPPATTSPTVRDLSVLSLDSSAGIPTTNISRAQSREDGEQLEAAETGHVSRERVSQLAQESQELSRLHPDESNVLRPFEEHPRDHNSSLQRIRSARTQVAQPLIIHEDSELGRLFKWYGEYESTQTPKDPLRVETHSQGCQEDINTATGLADDLSALARVSASNLLQVLALSSGDVAKHYMEFSFETSESDMEPLLQWVNRSTVRLKELISCYCLSLGCYSSQELKRAISRIDGAPEDVLKSAIESLSSTWPRDGGLIMTVSFGDSRKVLPLSPPFLVTGDGLVDVSEFIVQGKNRLQIHQNRDFSDYTFVLQIHTPKFKQLQEVVEHRTKEMEWKNWLVEITRPLESSTA